MCIWPAIGILVFLVGVVPPVLILARLVQAEWHITSLIGLLVTVLLYLPVWAWAVSRAFGWNQ